MFKESCAVVENRLIAPGHYVLSLRSKKISQAAAPGQFVQILCSGDSLDPLLPRPFSFLTAAPGTFSILYHVVGKGTERLSKFKKGDSLPVLGPLGNGFSRWQTLDPRPESLLLVGGGVGIPPLFHLAQAFLRSNRTLKKNIRVILGARNKSLLLCEEDFKKLGVTLELCTDDGSKGRKGFVTNALSARLKAKHEKTRIFSCGPTPMLKAVSLIAAEFGVPNECSVEVPMACGFGACLGCAIKVKGTERGSHRFAVACVEGPVFEGSSILWD